MGDDGRVGLTEAAIADIRGVFFLKKEEVLPSVTDNPKRLLAWWMIALEWKKTNMRVDREELMAPTCEGKSLFELFQEDPLDKEKILHVGESFTFLPHTVAEVDTGGDFPHQRYQPDTS